MEFATAALHGTLGDWRRSIEPLHSALEATPATATRDRFLYLCALLHAQLELRSWSNAESTALQLAPLIGTVGSNRPLARLAATIHGPSTHTTRDTARLRHIAELVGG
jgi:hypothetical protein